MMGSEEKEKAWGREDPIHEVKLDSFYIGKYPVTQGLWTAVMQDNPSFFDGDSRPVETVSWEDAQQFLEKLNELTGKAYRLPTEAEWEYAARGGNQSHGYEYAGSNKLKEVGWYWENSHVETKAVGLKYPNELGIYDMSGNVWEWCRDWYSGKYYEECYKLGIVENPQGLVKGTARVVRGGSWGYVPEYCRCKYRGYGWSEDHIITFGFRLALPHGINHSTG